MAYPRAEHYDRLQELFDEHGNSYAVAQVLGVSDSAVRKAAKLRGIELNPIGRPLSAEGDEWVRLRAAGMSVSELSAIYGKSERTIFEAINRRGLIFRPKDAGGEAAELVSAAAQLERLEQLRGGEVGAEGGEDE